MFVFAIVILFLSFNRTHFFFQMSASAGSVIVSGYIRIVCPTTQPHDKIAAFIRAQCWLDQSKFAPPKHIFISENKVNCIGFHEGLDSFAGWSKTIGSDSSVFQQALLPSFSAKYDAACYVDVPCVDGLGIPGGETVLYIPLRPGLDMTLTNCNVRTWNWLALYKLDTRPMIIMNGVVVPSCFINPTFDQLYVNCRLENGMPFPPGAQRDRVYSTLPNVRLPGMPPTIEISRNAKIISSPKDAMPAKATLVKQPVRRGRKRKAIVIQHENPSPSASTTTETHTLPASTERGTHTLPASTAKDTSSQTCSSSIAATS
jgi:hypothetical protein